MQPDRPRKPHRNNVRTGCITCKRRRVKCPEERPHCSRCVKAGFVCAGYAVPKTWIFKSSAEARIESSGAPSNSFAHSPCTSSDTSVPSPGHYSDGLLCGTPVSSLLQLGNSDPFSALPVQLGPRETHLLRMYDVLVAPRFDRLGSRHVVRLPFAPGWTYYGIRLEDEAAAHSLLARSAALEQWKLHGPHAASSTSLIKYVAMSQAALRKTLVDVGTLESPDMVYSIMWTSGILLMTDMLMGLLHVHLYSRAMSSMIVRYVELIDREVQPELILWPLYMDAIRSLMTITRPNVDMVDWFPRVFENLWTRAAALCSNRLSARLDHHVHSDIQDAVLTNNILILRDGGRPLLDLRIARMNSTDALLVANAIRTQKLWRYGQLLGIAIDVKELLKNPVSVSKQKPELIHQQIARGYVSFSIILWMVLTSPTSFASNAILNSLPGLLRQLKAAVIRSASHQDTLSDQDRPYAVSKLWALFVGVHAEYQHRDTQKTDFICGDWFFKTFQEQAQSMRIYSWQRAVTVLRQILHSDRLKPHISEWWHQLFPPTKSEDGVA